MMILQLNLISPFALQLPHRLFCSFIIIRDGYCFSTDEKNAHLSCRQFSALFRYHFCNKSLAVSPVSSGFKFLGK